MILNESLVYDRFTVKIRAVDKSTDSGTIEYDVYCDGEKIGVLSALATLDLSFSVGSGRPGIVVWAGTDVYLVRPELGTVSAYDHSDSVQAVYALKSCWCLVGDHTVCAVDLINGRKHKEFVHDEIILSSRWRDGALELRDLQNRVSRLTSFSEDQDR
jgi:hypothetical protein